MTTPYSRCCAFTFESDDEISVTRNVLGIKYSWTDLCRKFNRQGPSCPTRGAIHFKTISPFGPKLFAINPDTLEVFYHRANQWHQYQTSRNVRLGTLKELSRFFNNGDDSDNDDLPQMDNDGQDRDDDLGKQVKEFSANYYFNDLEINQRLMNERLCQMILLVQLPLYIIQCQLLTD